jgi:trk system potassium uptake protein
MNIIIAGGGKTIYFLCRSFTAKGYKVTIINKDHEECVYLSRHLKSTILSGDYGDAEILMEAGVMSADMVLAITRNDHDNLMICQQSLLQYNVPRVLALANDPDNVEVFKSLGIDAFSTTNIISNMIEQMTTVEDVRSYFPINKGGMHITEITIDEDSPLLGKTIYEVNLPEESHILLIIRDNQPILPEKTSNILTGDSILLLTSSEDYGPGVKAITGE